jgi:hypothetical protein
MTVAMILLLSAGILFSHTSAMERESRVNDKSCGVAFKTFKSFKPLSPDSAVAIAAKERGTNLP